jgi:hypothetical protein
LGPIERAGLYLGTGSVRDIPVLETSFENVLRNFPIVKLSKKEIIVLTLLPE